MADYGATREFRDNPFQDPVRFEEIVQRVTTNVVQINKNVSRIEQLVALVNTPKHNATLQDEIHEKKTRINSLIKVTADLFKQLNQYRINNGQLKMRAARLKDDFSSSVQKYGRVQQELRERTVLNGLPPSKVRPVAEGEDTSQWGGEDDLGRSPRGVEQQQQQEQAMFDDLALNTQREEQMARIERDMLDVNQVFNDLSALVYEQGEQIDSIENNVDHAYSEVERGNEQLSRAVIYKRKARKKCICLVLILLIVFLVIGLIIYLSIPKSN